MPPLAQTGRDFIAAAILGESTPTRDFNSSNARVLVGDSTGTFASSDFDMLGANRSFKAMDGTYPQRSVNQLTFRATFGTSEANHAWNEWGIKNSSATSSGGGDLLNRKQEAFGTKQNTQSWQFTGQITIST